MNLQILEQLERLRNEYLLTQDDDYDTTYYGSVRQREGDALDSFLDFLRDKLDLEPEEVCE